MDDLKAQWASSGVTVRLFKVGWQGRELSREAIVSVTTDVGAYWGNAGQHGGLLKAV